MKKTILLACFASLTLCLPAQPPTEHQEIHWPDDYHWKVDTNEKTGNTHTLFIIPGNEEPKTASIVGGVQDFIGTQFPSANALLHSYRSRINTAAAVTEVDRHF